MAFAVLLLILLGVLLAGVPIAFAIGGLAILGNQWFGATSFTRLAETQFSSINSFVITAIPFFILAGNVMLKGQMARSLFEFMSALTRWMTGGAAIGATAACAMFGALTGSSAASAAALSPVVIPELTRLKYPRAFSCGLLAAGGTLGIMIPPSVVFVVYGALTSTSVASLFLAGVIPGIFLALLLAITAWILSRKNGWGREPFVPIDVWRTFKLAVPSLLMPVIVLGGIYTGTFTPTEAAAVSVVYAILVTRFVYRTLQWRDLIDVFLESAKSSAVVLIILAASLGIGLLASFLGAADDARQLHDRPRPEGLAVPAARQPGAAGPRLLLRRLHAARAADAAADADAEGAEHRSDPLRDHPDREHRDRRDHAAGVGLNLFVITGTTGVPLMEVARGVVPFFIALLVGLFILTFVPSLSLVLMR